jgi:GT2 family glycosyltransferase
VWVILINWNTWKDTVECLESLLRQDYANYRVIVCDNGSTDGSLEHIRAWAQGRERPTLSPPAALRRFVDPPVPKPVTVHVTRPAAPAQSDSGHGSILVMDVGENAGFCAATNIALRHILSHRMSGYVWMVNNDMVVAPDALSRLVSFAQSHPSAGAIGGGILDYHVPEVIQIQGGGHVSLWTGFPSATSAAGKKHGAPGTTVDDLDFIAYGCLLAPLEVIQRVGLLNEEYFLYCEDIDHSLRIRRAGYGLAYDPDALVWHKGGASVVYRSARHDFYMARNTLLIVARFAPWRMPVAIGYSLYRCLLGKLVRGEWSRMMAVFRGYVSFIREIWPSSIARTGPADRMMVGARENAT